MSKGPMKTVKRVIFWGPLAILAVLYFFGQELGIFPGGQEAAIRNEQAAKPVEPVDVDETTVKVMSPQDVKFESTSRTEDNGDENAAKPESPRVLHLLIDDRNLFVAAEKSNGDPIEWEPIGLTEVVSRAKENPPNDAGLRVLVSRRGSSRLSTEMELREALHQAGLTDDEIHMEEKLTE